MTPTPLVVDVDGTLIKGDLLHEAALQFAAHHPLELWRLPGWLARGKAQLKAELARRADPHAATLPLRAETMALIERARAAGQPVWLASASDRQWVEPLAARIGADGVLASDGTINLAGDAKAAALVDAFGQGGFDYAGDHRVDLPVWATARRSYLVAHDGGLEVAARRRIPDIETIARPRSSLRSHWRALRAYQWAKNLLVFLPVVAGHQLLAPATLMAAAMAFLAFCCAASSAYIVNDLLDLPGDRDHPRKSRRPFAAGEIGAGRGLAMSALLMAAALTLALLLPARFVWVLAGYVAATLGYSLVLKRRLLIDVITLGGLYTLRVFGGIAAVGQPPSQWLLMFSLFLFLSLATVKRCSELVARRDAGKSPPPGRGYRTDDLAVLLPLGAAAGYGAVLVFALYLSSPEVTALYAHPMRMWLVCPLLLYWVSRTLTLSNRGELHDDPVIFALTDRQSWLVAAMVAVVVAVSI